MAEAIVGLTLLRIGEHCVGLRDLLEALLGGGIVRIAVGMELERELAVGLLELGLVRVSGDAQDLVVVALLQDGSASGGRMRAEDQLCASPPSVAYSFSVIL